MEQRPTSCLLQVPSPNLPPNSFSVPSEPIFRVERCRIHPPGLGGAFESGAVWPYEFLLGGIVVYKSPSLRVFTSPAVPPALPPLHTQSFSPGFHYDNKGIKIIFNIFKPNDELMGCFCYCHIAKCLNRPISYLDILHMSLLRWSMCNSHYNRSWLCSESK